MSTDDEVKTPRVAQLNKPVDGVLLWDDSIIGIYIQGHGIEFKLPAEYRRALGLALLGMDSTAAPSSTAREPRYDA